MSYFPPIHENVIVRVPSPSIEPRQIPASAPVSPISPARLAPARPTRPIIPGRISSMDSLDDRVRDVNGVNPALPLDQFERLENGSYRRVGSISVTHMPVIPIVPVPGPTHVIGWRTILQIFGVCVAMVTATIASFNLYSRTHGKSM